LRGRRTVGDELEVSHWLAVGEGEIPTLRFAGAFDSLGPRFSKSNLEHAILTVPILEDDSSAAKLHSIGGPGLVDVDRRNWAKPSPVVNEARDTVS